MCRFVVYLGPPVLLSSLTTEPVNSIIHQSFHSHERAEPLNGDGFGLVWYVPEIRDEAALFRSVSPAWSNQNLRHLARMTRSGCIFVHVRAASPGMPVTQTNTHPFCWRNLAFMHNGELAGFQAVKRPLLDRLSDTAFAMIEGTGDSEHLFALFLDRVFRQVGEAVDGLSVEVMAAALEGAVADALELAREAGVTAPSFFNLAVTDGRQVVACRFTDGPPEGAQSLHVHRGKLYVCERGVGRHLEPDHGDHAVIVASEALTDDPGWSVVEPNTLVLVAEDRSVEERPMLALG